MSLSHAFVPGVVAGIMVSVALVCNCPVLVHLVRSHCACYPLLTPFATAPSGNGNEFQVWIIFLYKISIRQGSIYSIRPGVTDPVRKDFECRRRNNPHQVIGRNFW